MLYVKPHVFLYRFIQYRLVQSSFTLIIRKIRVAKAISTEDDSVIQNNSGHW